MAKVANERGDNCVTPKQIVSFWGGLPYWIIHRVVPVPFKKSIAAAILLFRIIYDPYRAIWWDLCLTLRFGNQYLIRIVGIHKECLIFYQNVLYCESASFWLVYCPTQLTICYFLVGQGK